MTNPKTTMRTAALAALVSGLAACGGGDGGGSVGTPPAPAPVAVGNVVALTVSGQLISFDRATPGTLVGSVVVSGLQAGETLLGIDTRPADGRLYGLGSTGRLYTLDPATGVATLKSTLRAASGDAFTALAGSEFGVDFNPVADRLRVVSDTGQNLRINVDTGDTLTDGAIRTATGSARVSAAAYTNSFAGTTATALYDIDPVSGLLHLQDPPNAGSLAAGVPLGVTASAINGFDIDARSNTGYAVMTVADVTALYRVDLGATANAAVRIGPVAAGQPLRGLALMQPTTGWSPSTRPRPTR
ncbi:DUF4394 domain-containing protein [Piscinibacter sakaiensis]|uniref:DUF4394 domain-containing protein n=1 Tax=Piscinibacter sakaiensis TaxID=1547922 RepID=UPI00372733BB